MSFEYYTQESISLNKRGEIIFDKDDCLHYTYDDIEELHDDELEDTAEDIQDN